MPNVNAQVPEHSISLSSHNDEQFLSYLSPLDFFQEQPPFDTTFLHIRDDGLYNYPTTQDPIVRPPDPIAPGNGHHEQDMTDPARSPPYLRSRFRQEPLTHHNALAFGNADTTYSSIHANECIEPLPVPSLPPGFSTTSNSADHNAFFSTSIPAHASNSSFDDTSVSSYDLP